MAEFRLLAVGDRDNLADMHRHARQPCAAPLLALVLGASLVSACAPTGPFVADRTDKIPAASEREGSTTDDVFLRAPWERWRVPNGIGRYHRGMHLLLRDESDAFRVSDVSVLAADGSDVRLDYISIDLGAGSQSRVTISVSIYRARGSLDEEWQQLAERMHRKWPKASDAKPFPAPAHHPDDTLTMALLVPDNGQPDGTFVQTYLFRNGDWAARYDLSCATQDIPVARPRMLAFLGTLPVRQ